MRKYDIALREIRKPEPNVDGVIDLLRAGAGGGDHRAMYALATWYLHGTHLRKNFRKAVDLLHQAARLGNRDAMYDLAVCYEKGKGIKKDPKNAFNYYMSAAIKGDCQSYYEIGRMLHYGIGTTKNRDLSKHWRDKARSMVFHRNRPNEGYTATV